MKVLGTILVVLALVIGIEPQFTECQSQGKSLALANGKTVPMKCHWTARAEWVPAIPLVAVGAMMGWPMPVANAARKMLTARMSLIFIVLSSQFSIEVHHQEVTGGRGSNRWAECPCSCQVDLATEKSPPAGRVEANLLI